MTAGEAALRAGDLATATNAFDAALSRNRSDAAASAGRAHVALRRGEADMIARFRRARALAPADAELVLAEAEAEFVSGLEHAGATLAALVARNPAWVAGHRQLVSIRLERGEGEAALRDLLAALRADPRNPALWNARIGLLADIGQHRAAADAAAEARALGFTDPVLALIEASHAGQAGDLNRAERLLDCMPENVPGRAPVAVRHAFRRAQPDRAAALLEGARAAAPGDTGLWALTDLAWRSTGDPRCAWLSGQSGFIATIAIDLDLAPLAEVLRGLHRARAQPLGQSVRAGTQTRGPLFDRAEPQIAALAARVQAAVTAHLQRLPSFDATHPLLRWRNAPLLADGGWSVRLGPGGHHDSHIHGAGVLSSACYIALPPLDAGTREGWLELGRPPADLKLDLAPLAAIEPQPGRLVLFPSYLYHTTRPFSAGERLTVAFDARPASG